MDANLILIFSFVLVLGLIAVSMAHIFHKRTVDHEERKLELKAREAEARAEEARFVKGDYGKLEERVRVLERIATDGNHALASQIEELRGSRSIDDRSTTREVAQ